MTYENVIKTDFYVVNLTSLLMPLLKNSVSGDCYLVILVSWVPVTDLNSSVLVFIRCVRQLRKTTIRFVMSVRRHRTARILQDGFS